ncbi:MAG: hypothetical protein JNK07_02255 [Alphaproteobacteria bacterium]|nr:hypothetical protein [Alphaproteobacteria bacterium]
MTAWWGQDKRGFTTKITKMLGVTLGRRLGVGIVGFTPRRQDAKTGNIFGAKRLVHSLKGACGAKGEKSLSVLASWREKHGSSSAPPLIVGLSILVILVHLVVPSSFRPINAQRRWAVS